MPRLPATGHEGLRSLAPSQDETMTPAQDQQPSNGTCSGSTARSTAGYMAESTAQDVQLSPRDWRSTTVFIRDENGETHSRCDFGPDCNSMAMRPPPLPPYSGEEECSWHEILALNVDGAYSGRYTADPAADCHSQEDRFHARYQAVLERAEELLCTLDLCECSSAVRVKAEGNLTEFCTWLQRKDQDDASECTYDDFKDWIKVMGSFKYRFLNSVNSEARCCHDWYLSKHPDDLLVCQSCRLMWAWTAGGWELTGKFRQTNKHCDSACLQSTSGDMREPVTVAPDSGSQPMSNAPDSGSQPKSNPQEACTFETPQTEEAERAGCCIRAETAEGPETAEGETSARADYIRGLWMPLNSFLGQWRDQNGTNYNVYFKDDNARSLTVQTTKKDGRRVTTDGWIRSGKFDHKTFGIHDAAVCGRNDNPYWLCEVNRSRTEIVWYRGRKDPWFRWKRKDDDAVPAGWI